MRDSMWVRAAIPRRYASALLLAVAIVTAACSDSSLPPESLDPASATPATSVGQLTATPGVADFRRIAPSEAREAREALDAGVATFIDVRSVRSFETSHIPGALSIPLLELANRVQEIDSEQTIITYCT